MEVSSSHRENRFSTAVARGIAALTLLSSVLGLGGAASAHADPVVVFNEIMYHPATNETTMEWLELHNQMSVNIDMSSWSITGGVNYTFPEGTVIPGGGYLVIALSLPDIEQYYGITNVVGPFTGRLSNGGDTLKLRNNNNRVMDTLTYKVGGEWPSAPDGSGVSLAKRNENTASGTAANWTASALVDGTPGKINFPTQDFEIITTTPVSVQSAWKYSTNTPLAGWTGAGFDDSAWRSASSPFISGKLSLPTGSTQPLTNIFNTGVDDSGTTVTTGSGDPHYQLTYSAESTPPPPAVPATVMDNHSAWLANDASSKWIGVVPSGYTSVAAGYYNFRTTFDLTGYNPATAELKINVSADNRVDDILINNISQGMAFTGYSSWSGTFSITNGFVTGVNTLDFVSFNEGDGDNPAGFRAKVSGTASPLLASSTTLASGLAASYFRSTFTVEAAPRTIALQLGGYLVDGAVFYINGTEVLRLNMPSGTITSNTPALTNTPTVAYFGPITLPSSALVRGSNIFAVEVHRAASGTNLFFGTDLTMIVTNNLQSDPLPLAFNEISDPDANDGWIELINRGSTTINPKGCLLVRQRSGSDLQQYAIPVQTLAAGETILLTKSTLGFGLDKGDTFFLYNDSRDTVLDALTTPGHALARSPDGAGKWYVPAVSSPGGSNQVTLRNEIVINEIMYNPPTGQDAKGTWIELFNRSANSVDISGWTLAKDINYTFPTGTILKPGNFLVVAGNMGWMRTNYPSLAAVGPFTNSLKHREGRIQLQDTNGNSANEVHYFGDTPWPVYANGGGSSLELRNPWADNSRPESWAASDESAASVWTNVTYTATASQTLGPTMWKEFQMGLLDAGECLIDDLHAIESPTSSPVELLQNGTFTTGLTAWRPLGDHGTSFVETNNGTPVLHLIATSGLEHDHNHLETTLANGKSVTDGKTYTISYRAKWLAGNNRLNTRLYFNRLAQTTVLPVPALHGTPGADNSRYATTPGPTFANFSHAPVAPKSTEKVTVSVAASPGTQTATLYYCANSGSWKTVSMVPVSISATSPDLRGYTNYTAQIPAQTAGSLVQFYVHATDNQGASTTYPAAGINSRALYRVNDTTTKFAVQQLRILMLPADVAFLHQLTNVMSNARMPATLVYNDTEAFYNVGIHLQSSERGRDQTDRAGFSIAFPADHLFRGVSDTITVDRSGGWSGLGGRQDELLLWHAVNHAGGIPGIYNDLVQCYATRSQEDGFGMLRLGAFDSDYFDNLYDDGGHGNKFKLELIYYPTSTTTGNVQAPKLPEPDDVINFDFQDWGTNKENYRWIFTQENNADTDDYSQIIALNKAFTQTGANLETQINQLVDVDEYLRTLAFKAFTGDVDTYTYGYQHNWLFYFRGDTGKAIGLLWDMDYSYVASIDNSFPGGASGTTYNFVTRANSLRLYYNHLFDIATTTVNKSYLASWGAHFGGLLGQNWSGEVNYLQNRSAYILSKMPVSAPFAITSNSGRGYTTSASKATVLGTAPLTMKNILVNDVEYPPTWTSFTNWSIAVPLPLHINTLVFQGCDNRGNPLSNATATITITNSLATATRFVTINEWMADNGGPGGFPDSDSTLYSDWLELYNPNTVAVDLSGCYLTDDTSAPSKWQIPANTSIGAGAFLLIWADKLTNLNTSVSGSAIHANFKLSKSGSDLGLYGTNLAPWHVLTFGAQSQNVSQGLYPDGDTNSILSMPNWTPGAPNQTGQPPSPTFTLTGLGPTGILSFSLTTVPGRTCRIEYKNDLTDMTWTPLSTNRVDSTATILFQDSLGTQPHRFYRAAILP
jgi:hypothetical protein